MDIEDLLRGSIDMHVHHGPDVGIARGVDALQAARQAEQAGMKAIVLKSHNYPTAPLAIIVNQLAPGVKVFGSICLDFEIGGLNYHALEVSARLGAKVVWMPTLSSKNCRAKLAKRFGFNLEGEGMSILEGEGKLAPEIPRLLSIIKDHDMVLATGHLSPVETFALVEAARSVGISKLVITHAADADVVDQPISLADQRRLAQMGAFIEYSFIGLLPTASRHDPAEIVRSIRYIGAEHFIISSDLGQAHNPPPAEGMRMFIALLLRQGMTPDEVAVMVKTNPARLLGLD